MGLAELGERTVGRAGRQATADTPKGRRKEVTAEAAT